MLAADLAEAVQRILAFAHSLSETAAIKVVVRVHDNRGVHLREHLDERVVAHLPRRAGLSGLRLNYAAGWHTENTTKENPGHQLN